MGVDDVPSALYHPTTVRRIVGMCRRKASLVRCPRTGCTPHLASDARRRASVRLLRPFGGMLGCSGLWFGLPSACARCFESGNCPSASPLWHERGCPTLPARRHPVAVCFFRKAGIYRRGQTDGADPWTMTLKFERLPFAFARRLVTRTRGSIRCQLGKTPGHAKFAPGWSRQRRHVRGGTIA